MLAAIAAAPTDQLVRGVLADWLDDEGRHDEADAVRATKAKVPDEVTDRRRFVWWDDEFDDDEIDPVNHSYLPTRLFRELDETAETHWTWMGECSPHTHYPSFTAALLDLIRAWCAVHRAEVPA